MKRGGQLCFNKYIFKSTLPTHLPNAIDLNRPIEFENNSDESVKQAPCKTYFLLLYWNKTKQKQKNL